MGRRRVHPIDIAAVVHVLKALWLLLHRLEVVRPAITTLIYGQRPGLSVLALVLLHQVMLLRADPLALLACNDALLLDVGHWVVFFLFMAHLEVFLRERELFLLGRLLRHWNVHFVAQVTICLELDAPTELVTKDLGNLEVWLNLRCKNLLEILLL